jgi:probable HAF family extracellular repeat protein
MSISRTVQSAIFAMLVLGGVETAFAGPIYSFTTFNAPGATGFGTEAFGINDSGQIVGFFFDAGNTTTHGFLDTGGSFTVIDAPGASSTHAYKINDSGQIVGWFQDALGAHAFVDTGGSFTTINAPGATNTYAYGINDSGQIVGYFVDALGSHGFVDTGGSFTTLPGVATGINNSGQIAGSFGLDTGGSFTAINVPGASSTSASGINNSGQIVGSFNFSMGFLDIGGSFTTIDVPGFCCTSAQGINDNGQIVGWVGPPAAPEMAFVATLVATPEPPGSLTLAICLVALFGIVVLKHGIGIESGSPAKVLNRAYCGRAIFELAHRRLARQARTARTCGRTSIRQGTVRNSAR